MQANRHQRQGSGSTLIKICGVTSPEDAELAAKAGADFIGMIMWPKAKRAVSLETARQIAGVAKQNHALAAGVFVDEDAGDTVSMLSASCAQSRPFLPWKENAPLFWGAQHMPECMVSEPPGCWLWRQEQRTQPATPDCHTSMVLASHAGTIADACSQAGLDIAQLHGDAARAAVWDLPDCLQVIYVMHVDASGCLQTPPPAQRTEADRQKASRSASLCALPTEGLDVQCC